MKSILLIQLVLLFLVTQISYSQSNYPTSDFISPLDIPLKLSGTFGELRSNHFHSGIDIKTGEKTGLNIYAIANGYVSRIKVQSGGYGKALYITHPNGYVSVYGHLNKYNETINNWVIENQYKNQSYEVDLYLKPGDIEVNQGEIVAYSGNSGRSGGPHLHFEIRTASDQKPVNPLLFGYQVKDNTTPVFNLLKIYPFGPSSTVNGQQRAADFYPLSANSNYYLKNQEDVEAGGQIYFGINTIDLFNGGLNKNGVFKIEMLVNGDVYYQHELETFAFSETRYINSLIDYGEYKSKRRRIQKTYIQPNNELSIYKNIINAGILNTAAGKSYAIELRVSDAAKNTASLKFNVVGVEPLSSIKRHSEDQLFNYTGNNVFKNEWLNLSVPGNALYDTMHFSYQVYPKTADSYSAVHQLHNDQVPLHKWCTLAIRGDSVPVHLWNKTIIASVDNGEYESAGGEWENGFVRTRIRNFGNYCILVDTVAPEIIPINISNQKSLLAQQTIKLKIRDDLSGIKTYKPNLNGEWILMEYDAKNDLLTYFFDKHLKAGENIFKLEVWDEKNNYTVIEVPLNY